MTDPPKPPSEDSPWHVRIRNKVQQSIEVDRLLSGAKTVLEVGSDAAEILVELGNGVTVPGVAALTMRGVNTMRELRARSPAEHFAEGWKPLQLHGMGETLHEAFTAHAGVQPRPVSGMHDYTPAYTAELDDIEFGWAVSTLPRAASRRSGRNDPRDARVEGAWIRDDEDEIKALHALGRCVWTHLSTLSLLARNVGSEGLSVVPESDYKILPSRTGKEVYDEKLRPALEKGIHRSAFMIGDPGIGKSCMLRYIASLHRGLQLRFKLADMQDLSGTQIADIVEVLRPDVLLIDDFDRFVASDSSRDSQTGRQATSMLDPLERINELVPLFVVSANYNDGITPALLRPGRFDEIIILDDLEPELYAKMLPGAPDKLIKAIQRSRMPMAHVVELRKRAEASGWDWKAARKELRDLADRSNVVINLNERKLKNRKRRPSLAGKSQLQKAAWLEKRALREEKMAASHIRRSEALREKVQKRRDDAVTWREKAEEAKVKDAAKKAEASAKKAAKKAAKKKSTTKKRTPDGPKNED